MDIVKIGQITNAAVYVRDQELVGRFKEFSPPEIEYETVKHSTLGSVAELELPGRMVKSMKGKGTFDFLDSSLVPEFYDPRVAVPLMIEGYCDVFDGNGLNTGAGYRVITHISLSVYKHGGKAFKLGEAFEGEFDYVARRCVMKFSDRAAPFIEIDAINQINKLNGADVFSRY